MRNMRSLLLLARRNARSYSSKYAGFSGWKLLLGLYSVT